MNELRATFFRSNRRDRYSKPSRYKQQEFGETLRDLGSAHAASWAFRVIPSAGKKPADLSPVQDVFLALLRYDKSDVEQTLPFVRLGRST